MMIRVVRQAVGTVNGIALRKYQPGKTYEIVDASLSDYLVLEGLATIEMRKAQRSRRERPSDRRRSQ